MFGLIFFISDTRSAAAITANGGTHGNSVTYKILKEHLVEGDCSPGTR
jgi:hypothetical protein